VHGTDYSPNPKPTHGSEIVWDTVLLVHPSVRSNKKKGFIHLSRENYCFEIATFWLHFFELLLCLLTERCKSTTTIQIPPYFFTTTIGNRDTPPSWQFSCPFLKITTILITLKPCALNAQFQHFIPRFNRTSLLCWVSAFHTQI
jgi:hypothetical protein